MLGPQPYDPKRPLTPLLAWFWPGGLVITLDLLGVAFWSGEPWMHTLAARYMWVAVGIGALLSWRFRRSRVLAALVAFSLLALVPSLDPLGVAPGPWEVGVLIVMALVAAATVLKDRGILSPIGLSQIAGVVLCVWVGLYSADAAPDAWRWLDGAVLGWSFGPDGATRLGMLWLVFLFVAIVFGARRDHPIERGLTWALVAAFLAVNEPAGSGLAGVHLLAGSLVLALAVVETSYGLAFRDELTGLPARRALWQAFESAGSTYTVAMVDVDHFKRFNDRHGHDVGDQVLKMVGTRLARVGGGGRSFRYGGEEFAVLFPGKGKDEARPHLETLREKIAQSRFAVRRIGRPLKPPPPGKKKPRKSPRELSVTVSIGYAERGERTQSPESVIKEADKALYRAKKAGRNRLAG